MLAASATGPHDPSFRVRLALLAEPLSARGVELELLPLFSSDQARAFRSAAAPRKAATLALARRRLRQRLREAPPGASTIVVQRRVDPAPSLALERAAVDGRRLVYDVDDAVWLSGGQTGGHRLNFLKGASRKVRWLAERADHVLAGSELLAEHLRAYTAAVTVVPSLVDPAAYTPRRHEQGPAVTLGWIGSATTVPYLHRLAPILEQFAKQCDRRVRLLIVGGAAMTVAGVEVQERRWSPAAERTALAEMDIGLMPLQDTPWARGKCAYKALQYMAGAVPAVVDDVGVSAEVLGDAGHVANGASGWLEGLHALAADASTRAALGALGRTRVERDFSPARWLPTIARILRGPGD